MRSGVGIIASSARPMASCTDLLSEPFDNWSAWTSSSPGSLTLGAGRNGTAGQMIGTSSVQYPIADAEYVTVGFAFQTGSIAAQRIVCQLWNTADANALIHVRVATTGAIQVEATNIYTSAAGVIAINTWYYIELQVRLHATLGFVTLRVNGAVVISQTNVDTESGLTTVYNQLRLNGGGSANTNKFDDLYLSTGAGCAFKGDQAIVNSGPDVLREPFNHIASWTPQSTTPTIVAGRTGTAVQTVSNGRVDYTIPASLESDTVTMGFAYRATVVTAAQRMMVQFFSDTNTVQHVSLRHEGSDGRVRVYRDASNVIATSATGVIVTNTWQYVEIQTKLHDTTGFVIVRIDGVEVVNATGLDTKAAGTKTTFDAVRVGAPSISNTSQFDDLYLSIGGAAFKGDQVIT